MTPQQYLQQAKNLDALIQARLQEKETLQQVALSVRTSSLSPRVGGSHSNEAAYTRTIEKLLSVQQQLDDAIAAMVERKGLILSALGNLPTLQQQLVLRYRYLDGMTWEQIADLLQMSSRTIRRIHAQALQHFVVPQPYSSQQPTPPGINP